ncbi:hypothetical protein BKA62DRAFT_726161 [Auriculariales sp. MPI-PUGE-AT-0066]|nr:hypothetical protein BKA62DRAFT_726161 [Auriculariales sp. MPI-PUGE-AT-0066]
MVTVPRELDPLTYVKVVAFTLYHYDAFITFGDEGRSMNWTIAAFFIVRLVAMAELWLGIGLLFTTHQQVCRSLSRINTAGVLALSILVSGPIYVMYSRRRAIALINAGLCGLTAVLSIVWVVVFVPHNEQEDYEEYSLRPPWDVPCYGRVDHLYALCLIPPLLYVAYLAIMVTWKIYVYLSTRKDADNIKNSAAILRLLAWSSLLYFLAILAAVAAVITLWYAFPPDTASQPLRPMPAAIAVGGARLIISLRKELLAPSELRTTYSTIHDPPSGDGAAAGSRQSEPHNDGATHIVTLPSTSAHPEGHLRDSTYSTTYSGRNDEWELVEMGRLRSSMLAPPTNLEASNSRRSTEKGKARLSANSYD